MRCAPDQDGNGGNGACKEARPNAAGESKYVDDDEDAELVGDEGRRQRWMGHGGKRWTRSDAAAVLRLVDGAEENTPAFEHLRGHMETCWREGRGG